MTVLPDTVVDLLDQVRRSCGPVELAHSLPPRSYTSAEFYEFEKEAIFGHSWIFLAHVSQLPAPGDHLVVNVAGEPLVVTRDEHLHIHVLSAVCRHRSFVVVEEPGNARHLRCPYHAWTYGLDGRLVGAPDMGPGHPVPDLRAEICLPRLAVELWHGFIFANFDGAAAPLAPSLVKLDEELQHYRPEDLVVAAAKTYPDLAFNWKTMLENALEPHHTGYIHKGYHEAAPARLVTFLDFERGDGAVLRHAGFVNQDGGFLNKDGKAAFPLLPGITDEQRQYILFGAVPPAMFVSIKPDSAMVMRIIPTAVDRISLTAHWMFPPSTIDRPDFPELLQRQLDFSELVNRQDLDANARTYRGMQSRFAVQGPYSPYEASLPQFNQWLAERFEAYQS